MSEDPSARQARVLEALTQQIEIARAASPGPWHANAEHDEVLAVDGITVAEGFALSGRQLRATVDHIVAHNPDVSIKQLEGRRNILQRHAPERRFTTGPATAGLGAGMHLMCRQCAHQADGPWPCEDWRDASAGLEDGDA